MKTLKKVLLVAMLAIFSFGYASADFRWGIKAGMNFNKLDLKYKTAEDIVTKMTSADNQTGWMVGVMTEFTLPIFNLGMDASLMYARQNLTKTEEQAFPYKDFIDIPVNLKWKISLPLVGKIVSPIIYTGPDFLFALNKNTIKEIESKKCEVGWNIGLGLELLRHLQIQAGYCIGLNNVAKFTGLSSGTNVDYRVKKNYWTLTAAYLF